MTYESSSTTFSKRHRRFWPLVAALWTAVGLSPCALAAVGDLDCLHCPTEIAAPGHEAHAATGDHAGHAAAGHDMATHGAAASDCGDDCLDVDESLVDARGVKSGSKDTGETFAIVAVIPCLDDFEFPAATGGVDAPPATPVPRERLHAIHCVYLD